MLRALLALQIGLEIFRSYAAAAEPLRLQVPADVVHVYDGDTLTADAHPWPGLTIRTAVRLREIDAPEIRGKCDAEITRAKAARDRLAELVGGRVVMLEQIGADKYGGRVDARVTAGGVDVAERLVAEGLARRYDGGGRGGWCG